MKSSFGTLLAAGFFVCNLGQAAVMIQGVTTDCFANKIFHPRGVEVYLFDATKSARLIQLLTAMDSGAPLNDQDSIKMYDRQYSELIKLVRGTTPLARAKSDHAGSFRATIADTDSALVFGYAEPEDRPFYFTRGRCRLSPFEDFRRAGLRA